jgi:hypothetical protein
MDLETRFYELQDRYQTLINDYEQLKETHEADSSGLRDKPCTRCDSCLCDSGH